MNGVEPQRPFGRQFVISAAVVIVVAAFTIYLLMSGKVRKLGPESTLEVPAVDPAAVALEQEPVTVLFGAIAAVDGQTFTIDVPQIRGVDIQERSSRRVRKVIISSETALYERLNTSAAQYEEELAAYREGKRSAPPSPTTSKRISLTDFAVGDRVQVEAGENADIRDAAAFRASIMVKL